MTETSRSASWMAGGCQCGAVRYALARPLRDVQLCHCRMCQKAFGSWFAPLGETLVADLSWTKGEPALYRSSAAAVRGHCRDCGTPLTFQYDREPDRLAIALGSLDHPELVPPLTQYGIESRMPWFDRLPALPGHTTEASTPADLLEEIAGLPGRPEASPRATGPDPAEDGSA